VSIQIMEAPVIAIANPMPNAVFFTGAAATVQVTATAADNVMLSIVTLNVDGTPQAPKTVPPFTWELLNLAPGPHTLVASTRDELGQMVSSTPVMFTVKSDGGTFVEAGGLVSMEAETFSASVDNGDTPWTLETDVAGFSGEGVMRIQDPLFSLKAANEPSAELRYNIQITTTGTYHFYSRRRYFGSSFNSVYFFLNDMNPTKDLDETSTPMLSWVYMGPITIETPGVHVLTLKRRETRVAFDKLVLTKTQMLPTGMGPPQSQYESGINRVEATWIPQIGLR
jgi:hypothetical protein